MVVLTIKTWMDNYNVIRIFDLLNGYKWFSVIEIGYAVRLFSFAQM